MIRSRRPLLSRLAPLVLLLLPACAPGPGTSGEDGGLTMTPRPDGGMMPPRPDGGMMPPPDGGMMPPADGMMGPKACAMDTDCTGACPGGSKGCKCVAPPMMSKICVPTCTVDGDCPTPPMGSLRCDTQQGVCVPRM
jgi:hypothetical protein